VTTSISCCKISLELHFMFQLCWTVTRLLFSCCWTKYIVIFIQSANPAEQFPSFEGHHVTYNIKQ